MESRHMKILFKHEEMQCSEMHVMIRFGNTVEEYVMDQLNGLHGTHFTSIPVSVDVKDVHLTFLEVKQHEDRDDEYRARLVSECDCSLPNGDTLIVKIHAQQPIIHSHGIPGHSNIMLINTSHEHHTSSDDDSKIIATGNLVDLGVWNPSNIYDNILTIRSEVNWSIQIITMPEKSFEFKLTKVARKENDDCVIWEDPPFVNRVCGIDVYQTGTCWLCVSNWGNVENTFVHDISTTKAEPDIYTVARQIVTGVIANAKDELTMRANKKHGLYCQFKKCLQRALQWTTKTSKDA